jgi:hypothetical protein
MNRKKNGSNAGRCFQQPAFFYKSLFLRIETGLYRANFPGGTGNSSGGIGYFPGGTGNFLRRNR